MTTISTVLDALAEHWPGGWTTQRYVEYHDALKPYDPDKILQALHHIGGQAADQLVDQEPPTPTEIISAVHAVHAVPVKTSTGFY